MTHLDSYHRAMAAFHSAIDCEQENKNEVRLFSSIRAYFLDDSKRLFHGCTRMDVPTQVLQFGLIGSLRKICRGFSCGRRDSKE